jgi:16S rRNA processing protein RimM
MAESESLNPERLAIGVIVGPHGTRGEIRMQIWTHFPDHIQDLTSIFLDGEPLPVRLRHVRISRGLAILSLQDITTREAADELKGKVVRIDREQASPLEEGEYYHFELIGLDVFTEDGSRIGSLAEIIETGANDVYVVRDDEGKDTLFPALNDVVPEIDIEHRKMTVRPLHYWDG